MQNAHGNNVNREKRSKLNAFSPSLKVKGRILLYFALAKRGKTKTILGNCTNY